MLLRCSVHWCIDQSTEYHRQSTGSRPNLMFIWLVHCPVNWDFYWWAAGSNRKLGACGSQLGLYQSTNYCLSTTVLYWHLFSILIITFWFYLCYLLFNLHLKANFQGYKLCFMTISWFDRLNCQKLVLSQLMCWKQFLSISVRDQSTNPLFQSTDPTHLLAISRLVTVPDFIDPQYI